MRDELAREGARGGPDERAGEGEVACYNLR